MTVRRGQRTGWLLGPYDTHRQAVANVERTRCAAVLLDPWTGFDGFGTARLRPNGALPQGRLNPLIGLHPVTADDTGALPRRDGVHLDITAALIRELYDRGQRSRNPAWNGLVLTADAWEVRTWTSPAAPRPLALTAHAIDVLLNTAVPSDSGGLDAVIAALLQRSAHGGTRFAIPYENDVPPRCPGNVQVVTAVLCGDGAPPRAEGIEWLAWEDAWWFDHRRARPLITSLGHRDRFGHDLELWLTADGRYVARRTGRLVEQLATCWAAVTPGQAARWYDRASDADKALGTADNAPLPSTATLPEDQGA